MILMKSKSLFFVPYLFLFLEETHVCGLFFDRCSHLFDGDRRGSTLMFIKNLKKTGGEGG